MRSFRFSECSRNPLTFPTIQRKLTNHALLGAWFIEWIKIIWAEVSNSLSAVTSKGDRHMFPLVSSVVTRAPANSSFGRRATSSAITAGVAAIALLAGASNFANAAENSSRMAQEQHACAVVMGLHQPGDLYDTCIRSLNKTLSELHQARLASSEQSACVEEGLKPGTPTYAVCVVKAEQPPTDAAPYRPALAIH
jgi:hypothetical protein